MVAVFRRRSSIEAKQEVFRGNPALIVNGGFALIPFDGEKFVTVVVIFVVDVDGVLNCRC